MFLVFTLIWMSLNGIKSSRIPLNSCGFSMQQDIIDYNCTGYFTLTVGQDTTVHECGTNLTQVYKTIVLVYWFDCSTVLLDYYQTDSCSVVLYPLVLWPTVLLMSVVIIPITVWIRFLYRVRRSVNEKISVNRRGVQLMSSTEGDESFRKFSWGQLFVLGLCFQKVSPTCMPPIHSHSSPLSKRFTFFLDEGESACFDQGVVTHIRNVELSELGFLNNTSSWRSFVWSELSCGRGNCGSTKECGQHGEHGKRLFKPKKSMMYLKIC